MPIIFKQLSGTKAVKVYKVYLNDHFLTMTYAISTVKYW